MPPLLARIRRQPQLKTAGLLLLAFVYALSAGYSNTHAHDFQNELVNNFNQKLIQLVQLLEHGDHSGHNGQEVHDCTACKLQSKPLVSSSFPVVADLRLNYIGIQPETRLAFSRTPIKRLTHAPPVA